MSVLQAPNAPHTIRKRLLELGYVPLPVEGKACFEQGWTTANVDQAWLDRRRKRKNTGIRLDGLLAVDIDCDTPGLAEEIDHIVTRDLGPTKMARTRENSERILLLYAFELPDERLPRVPKFVDADGKTNGVDLLCGSSRQFVAFGTHPSGAKLDWPEDSPLDVAFADVPVAEHDDVLAAIANITAHLKDHDMTPVETQAAWADDWPVQRVLTPTDVFDVLEPPLGRCTVEMMQSALNHGVERLKCHLTAVRPDSDSGAGLAQLGPDGEVGVADFARSCVYKLKDEERDYVIDASEGLIDAESDALSKSVFQKQGAAAETALATLLDEYVYHISTGRAVVRRNPEVSCAPPHLAHLFGKKEVAAWISHPARQYAHDFKFRPDRPLGFYDEGVARYMNTYEPPNHKSDGGTLRPWKRFLEHLIPDEAERELFLDWLATKVQHPEYRLHALVFVAHQVQGCGRGTLFQVLGKLFSERFVKNASLDDVLGKTYQSQYNERLLGSLVITVSETRAEGNERANDWNARTKAYEHLKMLVDSTSSTIEVKRKGDRNTDEPMFGSFVFATNHNDALPFTEADRRFVVLRNGESLASKPELRREIHAWLQDEYNIGKLWRVLQRRPVEKYDPFGYAPSTRGKVDMIRANLTAFDHVREGLLSGPSSLATKDQILIAVQHLYRRVEDAEITPDELTRFWALLRKSVCLRPGNGSSGTIPVWWREGTVRAYLLDNRRGFASYSPGATKSGKGMLEAMREDLDAFDAWLVELSND